MPPHSLINKQARTVSLSTHITLASILLITAITLLLIALVNYHVRHQYLQDMEEHLTLRAEINGKQLEQKIEMLRQDVLFLAHVPPIQGILQATRNQEGDSLANIGIETWKKQLQETFSAFAAAQNQYFQIRFIGIADQGKEIVRVDRQGDQVQVVPKEQLQTKGDRDYVQETLKLKAGEVYLSEINLNREWGKVQEPHVRTLRAATPVYGPDNRVFGLVVINMDVAVWLDSIARDVSPGSQAYLMNEQGDYLIHPDAGLTFGFDLESVYRWQQDFPDAIIETEAFSVEHNATLRPISTVKNSAYFIQRHIPFDRQQPLRYLTLVYVLPLSIVNAQEIEPFKVIIPMVFAATLILCLLFLWYVRRTLTPLRPLTEAAHQIGLGHYDISLPEKAHGELAELITAFSNMIAQITARDHKIGQINAELKSNEAYAYSIIDSMPEGILVVDALGNIVRANTQMEQLFGYQQIEMLNHPVELLIPQRFCTHHIGLRKDYLIKPTKRMMGSGRDLFGQHQDGHEFPVEVGLSPIKFGDDQYIIVSIIDITERKAAEVALYESEERLRLMTSCVKDYAIIMLDPLGRVMTWNEGAQSLKGYCEDEILDKPMEIFYTLEEITLGKPAHLLQVASQLKRCEDEGWRVRKDGSRFYADVILTAMNDASGKLIGFTKITRDVSERKAAELEIQRLNSSLEQQVRERTTELQAANRELESFAYAIAHDLRAPLRAMSGFSQALVEDFGATLDSEARSYLDQIVIGSRRMGELVDGLLTLSRSTQGELQRDEIDISGLAERVLTELVRVEPDRRVTWEVEPGLKARGDARMLEAVMRNLLGNAWKYTSATLAARICVHSQRISEEWLLCIKDNGAGFDMAHAGKLFQPFQRLHRQEEFTGIGIGLATVQRIIHRHGGEIHAEGMPGQGACFCFSLGPAAISTDKGVTQYD